LIIDLRVGEVVDDVGVGRKSSPRGDDIDELLAHGAVEAVVTRVPAEARTSVQAQDELDVSGVVLTGERLAPEVVCGDLVERPEITPNDDTGGQVCVSVSDQRLLDV
jgi:hypothetical protein